MTKTSGKAKLILSVGIMAAALVIGVVLWVYYKAPSSYFAIDVNPSIEIHTNRLNEVTSIEPINADAKQLMAGYELTDKNIETVIKNIVDRMMINGYIAPDKDNQILITTKENQNAEELTATVDSIIAKYLTEKQVDANVIPQSIKVTTQSIKAAHKNHVSIGKMAIIQKLMQADSTLKLEDLTPARVSDLVALAKSKNISLVGLGKENDTQDITSIPTNQKEVKNDVNIEDKNDNNYDDNDIEENNDGHNDKKDHADIMNQEDSNNEDHSDADFEDQKDSENEDHSDADFEDQKDSDKEDQDNAAIKDQKDIDKEKQDKHNKVQKSKQKHNYSQDQNDNENESDNEDKNNSDYEYQKSGDSQEQKNSINEVEEEKDSDSEKSNEMDNHNYDHESDREND